jgi:putative exosortase-associated protein (TIGR04073 family)
MLYSVEAMKMVKIALIILIALFLPAAAFADEARHEAVTRAERGASDVLFGWTDIPRSIVEVTGDTGNPLWGLVAGTFNGIGKAFPRMVAGLSDIATLPAADHNDRPVRPSELNTQIR